MPRRRSTAFLPDLRDTRIPDRYALFGNPLGHSKSPLIHATFARETRQDLVYELIESPLDGFAAAVAKFRAQGGRGMNVTMPFKLEAFALATDLSERARLSGAVNAIKVEGDRLLADLGKQARRTASGDRGHIRAWQSCLRTGLRQGSHAVPAPRARRGYAAPRGRRWYARGAGGGGIRVVARHSPHDGTADQPADRAACLNVPRTGPAAD
jgi:hypothetical protein